MNIINIPNTICFRVTRNCNMKCPFCQAPTKEEEKMSFEEICQILKIFKKAGVKSIKFTGGEPYVRREINDILQYCYNIRLKPVVCTNGTLMSQENIDTLQKIKAKVKISLHGFKEQHNTITDSKKYNIIVENIKRLLAKDVFTSLHVIVNPLNLKYMEDFINIFSNMGVKKISLIALVERGKQKNNENEAVSITQLSKYHKTWKQNFLNKVDLRLLDFTNDYYVLESDKSLWIQRGSEGKDSLLCSNVIDDNYTIKTLV